MLSRGPSSDGLSLLSIKGTRQVSVSLLLASTLLLTSCGGGGGDTASSGSSATVLLPTNQGTSGSPAQELASDSVTAKTPFTLSDFLAKKAVAATDDKQGKFLNAVAEQMRQSGIATDPALLAAPRLSVSTDRKSLLTGNGQPFSWMSDTAWMWLYRLSMDERREFLAVRKEQGFNVLLFQMLTGGYGQKDMLGNTMFDAAGLKFPDISRAPNVKFWAQARRAVEDIAKAGIVPAMVLTWGAQVRTGFFDKDSAYDYGRLIGRSFGDLNMIFILGGDINPTDAEKPIWDAMAEGIRAGEPHRNLITFHPSSGSASDFFADREWLDIDGMQSGHARFRPRTKAIGEFIYQRYVENRKLPIVDLESGYERIVDGLYSTEPDVTRTVADDKRLDAYDMRVRAYQQWVSGAIGYGYGEVDSMRLSREGVAPYWPVNQNWRDALNAEGAGQLRYFQRLRAEVGPVLVPAADWSELNINVQDYFRTLTACNPARTVCVAYDTDGTVVTLPIAMDAFRDCVWMNPRTGVRSACAASKPAKGTGTSYIPPVVLNTPLTQDGKWYRNNNDWVLILRK